MSETEFVDTNVLVYAHDRDAKGKRVVARRLVASLWRSGRGVLSTQVLAELFVVLTRKVSKPLSVAAGRRHVALYSQWLVVRPDAADVLEAIDLVEHRTVHFWDALLIVSAQRAGATKLWSENLQSGSRFGPLEVRNPFTDPGLTAA